MDRERYYREDGYQKGFEDAKKTGGKIRQEYIDNYLHTETKNLSTEHTREFIEGWYKGFNDGVMKTACKLATNDEFWGKHIFWENPQYKVR